MLIFSEINKCCVSRGDEGAIRTVVDLMVNSFDTIHHGKQKKTIFKSHIDCCGFGIAYPFSHERNDSWFKKNSHPDLG